MACFASTHALARALPSGARALVRDRRRAPRRASFAPRARADADDPLVHSSSLVSTRLAPAAAPRPSAAPAPGGSAPGADDAAVHGSSLVATRLSPTGASSSATSAAPAPGARGANPAAPASDRVTLYVAATCPFAARAWIALLEKRLDPASCDVRVENLAAKSANLQDAFAAGTPDPEPRVAKVPVLQHAGKTLVESGLCADYIAEAFPATRDDDLAYRSAVERYDGELFVSQFDAVVPAYFAALRAKNQGEADAALDRVRLALRQSERALVATRSIGPFAAGSRFTVADAKACTMIPRLEHVLKHYRGFELAKEVEAMELTKVRAWMDACEGRESVRAVKEAAAASAGESFEDAIVEHSAKFVSWTGK